MNAHCRKEVIKNLNNKAVEISNECGNYISAIEHFHRALILTCKQEDPSISSSVNIFEEGDFLPVPKAEMNISHSRILEPDEGLYSYTRTLQILSIRRRNIDPEVQESSIHSTTIHLQDLETILCFNLAVCYLLSDQDQEAMFYFNRTGNLLQAQPETPHGDEPFYHDYVSPFQLDSIVVLHNIGLIKFRAGKYKESLQCYIEAVAESISKYEAEDMSVAVALNTIGVLLSRTAKASSPSDGFEKTHEDALAALQRSLNIRANILGVDAGTDKDMGTVLNNIGRMHFVLNDIDEALNYHEAAYQVRKLALGEKHIDTGVASFNIGQCYQALKKADLSFKYYSIFVESIFQSANLQSLTKNIVRSFEHIAACYHEDENYEHASPFYDLALQSSKRIFGEKDAHVAQILNQRGNMFCELSSWDYALQSYKDGLEIERIVYPSNHQNIITTEENIARVLGELAQLDCEE